MRLAEQSSGGITVGEYNKGRGGSSVLRLRAVADPGFMDRGADILLSPPTLPLLLSSLLLPLIPPLFFLDVQARTGGWRTPSPHARSAPGSECGLPSSY